MVKFLIATGAGWLVALGVYLPLIRAGRGFVEAVSLAYLPAILATAIFHVRYVRTQREFLTRQTPWVDFAVISAAEWIGAALAAMMMSSRVRQPGVWETFIYCFGFATLVRYVLRKEFLLDIRGLRRNLPRESETGNQ